MEKLEKHKTIHLHFVSTHVKLSKEFFHIHVVMKKPKLYMCKYLFSKHIPYIIIHQCGKNLIIIDGGKNCLQNKTQAQADPPFY